MIERMPPPVCPPPCSGRLLIATPLIESEEFRRTVILLLDHGPKGSVGVTLNRPMLAPVSVVLPAWQARVCEPATLFSGGPVCPDQVLGLLSLPGDGPAPPGSQRLLGSIAVVNLDSDPDPKLAAGAGLRIFNGYAGWSPGQLVREITRGSWFVVEAAGQDAFTALPQDLWRSVLRRQRGALARVSTFPADPQLN